MLSSSELRLRRKNRQRTKISRVIAGRHRLCVHRTGRHMYAQIIDDSKAITVAAASTLGVKGDIADRGGNVAAAAMVGELIALKAKKLNISTVVFDRSGFLYHGRIKALADSARKHGLVF